MALPDMLFKKPAFSATISIPEKAAAPKEITAEMSDNIVESIKGITGMEVHLTVQNEESNNQ